MKNSLSTLFIAFLSLHSFSQLSEVRFSEGTFDNGMTYPIVQIAGNKIHQDSINADLRRRIADLEASDFCIGQYGYVQKSTHLQIHIFCNCIDFKESENRYFLYNLEEGRAVPYSDLFNPKEKSAATEFLLNKVKTYAQMHEISFDQQAAEAIQNNNLDAMHVEMTKDGLKVNMPELEGWETTKTLMVTWVELKPFLKYHFI